MDGTEGRVMERSVRADETNVPILYPLYMLTDAPLHSRSLRYTATSRIQFLSGRRLGVLLKKLVGLGELSHSYFCEPFGR